MAESGAESHNRQKVLFIAFKYLGDVVVAIPAIRAFRDKNPRDELHVLVAEDAVPLVSTLPWIDRVWSFPRTRGKMRLRDSLPVIRALRRERFDVSADLIGNDRGAFLSLAIGARVRYGLHSPRGFLGRSACYHVPVPEAPAEWHETRRHLHYLRVFGVDPNSPLDLELRADPAQAAVAETFLPQSAILAHVSTSKPLKEWPIPHWCTLAELAWRDGFRVIFSSGPTPRERALLAELRKRMPHAQVLGETPNLSVYLAVLARAQLLVSGDTGPMHFAAGLGVPTLSIFGPSLVQQWAPIAPKARTLRTVGCTCDPNQEKCTADTSCFIRLDPEAVWNACRELLPAPARPTV
jgi:heptosyltransferase III